MSFGSVLKNVFPTIATVLGGPFAGLAVEAVGSALGMSEPTKEKVQELLRGPLSGEQITALKMAENNLVIRMRELDIQVEQLEVEDRKSAREREIKAGGQTTSILAWSVIGGFIVVVFAILFGGARVDSVLAGTVIGYVSAKADQVLSYYFGSSRGSDDKTKIIDKMSNGTGNGK